ncbi:MULTISPECIES: PPOX class F420-dependent oxidoreductase [Nocardia]|nr:MULTISPECIES: PPOX class F420-dependent oxidoreductase [Nocardia]
MNDSVIPESHIDLLTRPLYGHLATLNLDGTPQVTPVWQIWDGTHLRFTTTTDRRKAINTKANPHVAISINDPDQPYRYLEVRGVIESIDADPDGEFFDVLARRYGLEYQPPVGDHERRVILVLRPTRTTHQ